VATANTRTWLPCHIWEVNEITNDPHSFNREDGYRLSKARLPSFLFPLPSQSLHKTTLIQQLLNTWARRGGGGGVGGGGGGGAGGEEEERRGKKRRERRKNAITFCSKHGSLNLFFHLFSGPPSGHNIFHRLFH
jgi:hypothetical protein